MTRLRRDDAEVWFDRCRYSGTPCIYGTRIPVHMVIGVLMEGPRGRALLRDDYDLTERQIDGAVAYTMRMLGAEPQRCAKDHA